MRPLAKVLAPLAVLLGLAFAAAFWLSGRLDQATVKARIAQAMLRSSGYRLALNGPLTWRLGPEILVEADDVALANPPGFSRPALLLARHARARVALLPLLRHDIVLDRLELTEPDLKLERTTGAGANWRQPPAPPRQATPEPAGPSERPWRLTVLGLTATDGAIAWNGPGWTGSARIARASLLAANVRSSITVDIAATLAGDATAITGTVGAQTHLWSPADHTPWPVRLRLQSPAGSLTAEGTIARPLDAAGYDLAVTANGPDLGRLGALWPGLTLPRLRDMVLTTRLIDRGGPWPAMPRLVLTAGPSDLGNLVPGLLLDRLDLSAPNLTGDSGLLGNRLRASGRYAGQPLTLTGSIGPPRGRPVPVQATLLAAGAALDLSGRVAPADQTMALTLHATVPDLAALSPLAGLRLPRLHDLILAGTASGTTRRLDLHALGLTGPVGDLDFDGRLDLAARPAVSGTVRVKRLDLDALLAAWPTPPPPLLPALAAPVPAAPASPLDADLQIQAAATLWRGVTLADGATHLVLDRGRLRLVPLGFSLAGAALQGAAAFDPAGNAALTLHGTRLPLAALARLAGAADPASGALDLDLALSGTGHTAAALAASLAGHVTLTLASGTIGSTLAATLLAPFLRGSPLASGIGGTAPVQIACFGARADLAGGIATLPIVYLDLDRARLAITGTADLGTGTVALRLLPYVRLGRGGIVVPLRAAGDWRQPALRPEPATATPDPLLGLVDRADCAAALTVAQGGALPALPKPARLARQKPVPRRVRR